MILREYSAEIHRALVNKSVCQDVDKVIDLLLSSKNERIFTGGNGGSSSSASHFSQDLMKICNRKSFCMSDNTPFVLAISNDVGFSRVYSSYLALHARTNDILFLISGSGNSQNLIEAVWTGKSIGMHIVSLVGFDGGILKTISNLSIHVPLFDMRLAESSHSTILHYIIERMNESV
jgi:D-sedoheptulose 7-phosphate isomerase